MARDTYRCPPIAIVGLGTLLPGSDDPQGFWRNVIAGRDQIRDIPPEHWLAEDFYDPDPTVPDRTYAKRGAFLSGVPFDPMEWGIPPNSLAATDVSQLLALLVARQVLRQAGGDDLSRLARHRTGVILGLSGATQLNGQMVARLQRPVWLKAMREAGLPESEAQDICRRIEAHYQPWGEATFPGMLGNVVAGRVANRFDLGGTNCIVDAACASSLAAISMAMDELALGRADLMVVGGVDTLNDAPMFIAFSKTPALSPTQDCRPFSADADGTMLGEGLSMLALKRLDDAERDGDRVYAVLKGIGSSSDGRAKSIYAPLSERQAVALRRAYESAGHDPATVELIEAHGTGTKAGDAAEFEGLKQVFPAGRARRALGSVKSQLGHTKAAAAATGMIKTALALRHGLYPPTIKVARPNPRMEIEGSGFYLNTQPRPWVRGHDHPRRAGVSSFGFGGSNFHVALEEYTGPHRPLRFPLWDEELVVLGAADAAALAKLCEGHAAALGDDTQAYRRLARLSRREFSPQAAVRLAFVTPDNAHASARLTQAAAHLRRHGAAVDLPGGLHFGQGEAGAVAFLFPGQGSQYVQMGGAVAMAFDEAKAVWDDLGCAMAEDGDALHHVVFPPPVFDDAEGKEQEARLARTELAQPALGVVSLSFLAVLERLGIAAAHFAGHSFGELTALTAAGAIRRRDLPKLATLRGFLMAEAADQPGAMIAVHHPLAGIEPLLAEWGGAVVVANINGPQQVVLSGPESQIGMAAATLAAKGIACKRLNVSTAFHSPLVASAAKTFGAALADADLSAPKAAVYANISAEPYAASVKAVVDGLSGQIAATVRFEPMIRRMYDAGARIFVEVGPGSVLTGLVGSCLDGKDHRAIALDKRGDAMLTGFLGGLARLAAAGVAGDYAALDADMALPEAAPVANAHVVMLSGVCYGKSYPPPGGAAARPALNPERVVATPPPAAVAVVPAPPPSADLTQAFTQFQSSVHDRHASWQDSMTQGHLAAIRAMESAFALIAGGGANPAPVMAVPPALMPAPAEMVMTPLPAPVPVPVSAPAPAPASSASLSEILLEVVAQRTGYPADMLSLDMAMEADLGIDSIKRVEIFSALAERIPALSSVDASEVAALATLGHILDALNGLAGEAGSVVVAKDAGAAPARDRETLLLEVVAQRTGYPADMLSLDMAMEADLGIDSIKRVEIFSALADAFPALATMEPGDVAVLSTLRDLLGLLGTDETSAEETSAVGASFPAAKAPAPMTGAPRRVLSFVPVPSRGEGILSEGPVEVIDGGSGLGDRVVEALARRGIAADTLTTPSPRAQAVILLHGLCDFDTEDAALAANRQSFLAVKALAPRFASTAGGVLVTVQDTGGAFGTRDCPQHAQWAAGLAGLAKTAALEWPHARVKAVDLERAGLSADAIADALVDEVTGGGTEVEIGLKDGKRLRAELVETGCAGGTPAVSPDSVLVVTGGGRGVTAQALIGLAAAARPRIALLGRTLPQEPECCRHGETEADIKAALMAEARADGHSPLPVEIDRRAAAVLAGREVLATLEALKAHGAETLYLPVDVRDHAALDAALAQVRSRFGAITGLVHGAGVLADKRLDAKTPEQFDLVFDTKAGSLLTLLRATKDDPLRLMALFSSVSARFGNTGQADYAMANEVLNKVAWAEAARRGPACKVKTINWGPWQGGMVSPSLAAHFTRQGIALLSLGDGVDAFVREVQHGPAHAVEVVVGQGLGARPAEAAAE